MPGDKNKHAIWVLLLSLLALTTIFQKNYHNNQLVITPKEIIGLYCRYLLFLSGLSLVLGLTRLVKAVYMVLGSSYLSGRKILAQGASTAL